MPGEPLAGVDTQCRHFKARLLKSLDISKLKPAPPTELQGWDGQAGSESAAVGYKMASERHAHGDSRTEAPIRRIPSSPHPPCFGEPPFGPRGQKIFFYSTTSGPFPRAGQRAGEQRGTRAGPPRASLALGLVHLEHT